MNGTTTPGAPDPAPKNPHPDPDSPDPDSPDAARTAVARLKTAADHLAQALAHPVPDGPWRASQDEELCDRLVDLAAALAWHDQEEAATGRAGTDRAAADRAATVLRGCALWTVDADTARTLAAAGPAATGDAAAAGPPAAAHGLVARSVAALAEADVYDTVRERLRTALGPRPQGRAGAAWDIAAQALAGLGATRDEWVGADPAHTAAGGWVLVERIGRLRLTAALLASAGAHPAEQAETCVNAARRYTWNWLRLPPPEAATAVHVQRTAELVRWIRAVAERRPAAQRDGA